MASLERPWTSPQIGRTRRTTLRAKVEAYACSHVEASKPIERFEIITGIQRRRRKGPAGGADHGAREDGLRRGPAQRRLPSQLFP
jgi:hypothetical protein